MEIKTAGSVVTEPAVYGKWFSWLWQDELILVTLEHIPRRADLERQIEKLAARKPRLAETFDLHYFGGLTFEEISEVLDIDPRTAKRDWEIVLQWLKGKLGTEAS